MPKAVSRNRPVKLSFTPSKVTKKLLKDLQNRMHTVISERFGLETGIRKTLESIGAKYNITRERVRQLEKHALGLVRQSKSYDETQAVFTELKNTIDALGGVVHEQQFLETMYPNDVVNQNHLHFYLTVADNFNKGKGDEDFHDHWFTDPIVAAHVREVLKTVHQTLQDHELLEEAQMVDRIMGHELIQAMPPEKVTPATVLRWLDISRAVGKNSLGYFGLSKSRNISTRGVKDLAYLVLREHGSPLHFREITQTISNTFKRPVNTATAHNVLISDDRFVLIGRGVYALASWGYQRGSARDVIRSVLLAESHPLSRQEIIDKVMKERHLKPNTILVNLQNPQYFVRDANGLYSVVEQ